MLKFYDVSKIYDKKTVALNKFTMFVKEKQIHALLGHNGAGKTTAFMVANKFIPFDKGEIIIKNKNIKEIKKNELKKIGIVTDKMQLYNELTVKETLNFFASIHKIKNQKKKILEISEKFELSEFLNKKIKSLSTGMYKKTIIAISLIGDPFLVFLDEPFSGVDPVMLKKISKLIEHYRDVKGTTFIISSHNLSEVEIVSDFITIIKEGSTIISDSKENLFKKYNLEKSFKITYINNGKVSETEVKGEEQLLLKLKELDKNNTNILTINENKISLNDIYNEIYQK